MQRINKSRVLVGGHQLVSNGETWLPTPLDPVLMRSGARGRRSGNGAVNGSPVNGAERWAGNFAAPLTCSVRNTLRTGTATHLCVGCKHVCDFTVISLSSADRLLIMCVNSNAHLISFSLILMNGNAPPVIILSSRLGWNATETGILCFKSYQ